LLRGRSISAGRERPVQDEARWAYGRERDGGECAMKARGLPLGAGMRLGPITHISAKQFFPVANEAAFFHGPDATAVAGITGAARLGLRKRELVAGSQRADRLEIPLAQGAVMAATNGGLHGNDARTRPWHLGHRAAGAMRF
jgi:hypothetical protein